MGFFDKFFGRDAEPELAPVRIEPARSNRSRCQTCRKKIDMGALRFGRSEQDSRSTTGRQIWRWFHLDCAADSHPFDLGRALGSYQGEVAGRLELLQRVAGAESPPKRPSQAKWWRAVEAAEVAKVARLIEAGADTEWRHQPESYTSLHLAARQGSAELIETLIAGGADVEAKTPDHYSALHFAVSQRSLEAVDALLKAGAKPNVRGGIEDMAQETPLHLAFESRDSRKDLVRRLLEAGANPNLCNYFGDTALHLAASTDDPSLIQLLVEHGADLDRPTTDRFGGLSPLHRATWSGRRDSVRTLLELGANPNAQTTQATNWMQKFDGRDHDVMIPAGTRPLDLALALQHVEVQRCLEAASATAANTTVDLRLCPWELKHSR